MLSNTETPQNEQADFIFVWNEFQPCLIIFFIKVLYLEFILGVMEFEACYIY